MAERSIIVRLRAEVGQYKQAMTDAGKATQQVGQQAVKSARDNREAWTTAGAALTTYGAGVTAMAAAVLKTGIAYNQLQQTSRAALTTLTGSAVAANAQMDKLDDFARNSPFAKQVFIQAQQQMLGFGIEAQKVIPYLDAIQNAVAATGGSNNDISELSRIMSQISASAKITATDLREFGNRGIDAATIIGSQMGMTGAQIRESITAGTLDAGQALDALAAGMSERFDGAADNVKNTFTGAIDRVKAAWRDFAADLTAPLVGPQGGGVLVDMTNQAADLMRTFDSLPGPVKQVAAAVIGLSGAASLLGGALLLALPRIIATRAAVAAMRTDMPGLAAGMDRATTASKALGKGLLAAGLVAGALSLARAFRESADELQRYVDITAAAGGGDVETKIAALTDELERQQKVVDDAISVEAFGVYLAPFSNDAVDARYRVEALTEEIERLEHQKKMDAAESKNSARATESMSAALQVAEEAFSKAQEAAEGAAETFAGPWVDALSDADTSIDQWAEKVREQTRALRNFRENAQEAAEKGLRQGIIEELIALGAEGAPMMAKFANASEEEIRRANRAHRGFQGEVRKSVGEVDGLGTAIAGIPSQVRTQIIIDGIQSALANLARVRDAMSGLGALNPLRGVQIPNTSADGSTVPKDGGPYSDRYPYLLAPGEEVISNRYGQADRHRPLLKAINAGRLADGGTVGGLASGGTVDRATRRAFDLGGGMSARDVRREFAELRKALGGNTRALEVAQKQSERLAKAWNRLDERIERRSDRLDSLRSDRDSLVSAAAGSFNNDIFGNGVAGLRLQLEADRNDAQAMRRALAGTQGLGKGLMAALASSGDLATAQELAGMSRREVRQLSRLYNQRGNAQAALGTYAGDAVYGREIKAMTAELRESRQERRRLNRALNTWERAAERMPNATAREIRRAVNRQALPAGKRSK